jgi:hypothetical protein
MRVPLAQLLERNDDRITIAVMRQGTLRFLTRPLCKELTPEALSASCFNTSRNAVLAMMTIFAWPVFGVALSAWHVMRFVGLL